MHSFQLALLVLTTATICLALFSIAVAWQRRGAPGVNAFVAMVAMTILYNLSNLSKKLGLDFDSLMLATKIEYIAIATLALLWFLFILEYTQQDSRFTRPFRISLWVVPVVSIGLVWSNAGHGLMWRSVTPEITPLGTVLRFNWGPGFWMMYSYLSLLVIAGLGALLRAFIHFPRVYRQQVALLAVAALIPAAFSLAYINRLMPPPGWDLTAQSMLLVVLAYAIALLRYRMMDLIPIAREVIIANLTDGLLVVDPEQFVIEINPRAERLLNQTRLAMLGQPLSALFPPESHPALAKLFSAETQETQIKMPPTADGAVRQFELRCAGLSDKRDDRAIGWVLNLRDTSQRVQIEQMLRLQSAALNAAANGVVITDQSGRIEWVNPSFTHITGYTQEEANGQNPRLLRSGRHDPAFYAHLWQTISSGQVWHGEVINRRKDQRLYTEEMTIAPVIAAQGQIRHYVAIKQDVSQRKQSEAELTRSLADRQRRQEAEAIDHEHNRIAQEIHDGLAQNLAAMRMRLGRWPRLLNQTSSLLDDEIKEMLVMVDDSIVEARRSVFALRPLALDTQPFWPALQSFVDGFSEYYNLHTQLILTGDETCLPDALELPVFRMIQEGLNNIARHAQALNAWVMLDLHTDTRLHLQIRDDGCGFDPGRLEATEHEGHFGLRSMQQRVYTTGGSLSISSQPGQGTALQITIPFLARQP